MARRITVRMTRPADQVLTDVRRLLAQNGFDCRADAKGGSFSGMGFEGTFAFVGQDAEIEVQKAPSLVPWSMVESKVQSIFGN